ncbi:alkyl sulfatase dimerization domain-containing protein [Streptomyces sp. NPDC002574]|uniref:alkyl sulfatase dimerization domain-containing protein n=1 Tax=Streptomyces sp. NPDC002574 TaxID=3364652 RepID=UPI0036BF1B67
MELPPALERARHTHGYYGSVSHNTKAIYRRYLGWFDGNPAHLWEHPPVEAARRYVEFMGGAHEVLRRARQSFADGDFRWVAQVVDHVVFAEPDNAEARTLQSEALEQLGYGNENGTWRNFYLMGALELRHGSVGTPTDTASPDILAALTLDQLFDALAIRIDGPRSWDADIAVRWNVAGRDPVTLHLHNGVLRRLPATGPAAPAPDATFTLGEPTLRALLLGALPPADLAAQPDVTVTGDPTVLAALFGHLAAPDPDFAIITP